MRRLDGPYLGHLAVPAVAEIVGHRQQVGDVERGAELRSDAGLYRHGLHLSPAAPPLLGEQARRTHAREKKKKVLSHLDVQCMISLSTLTRRSFNLSFTLRMRVGTALFG